MSSKSKKKIVSIENSKERMSECTPAVPQDTEEMWEKIKDIELMKIDMAAKQTTRMDNIWQIRSMYQDFFKKDPDIKDLVLIADHLKGFMGKVHDAVRDTATWERMKTDPYNDIFGGLLHKLEHCEDDLDLFFAGQEFMALRAYGGRFEQLADMAKNNRLHELIG